MAKHQPPTPQKTTTHQRGEPFPRSLRLSAADTAPGIAAKFAMWVKLSELPECAILARFVGTADRTLGAYVNETTGARMGDEVNDMETLCHLTVTSKPAQSYLILAPQPAPAHA
jgi:hypothetical protein